MFTTVNKITISECGGIGYCYPNVRNLTANKTAFLTLMGEQRGNLKYLFIYLIIYLVSYLFTYEARCSSLEERLQMVRCVVGSIPHGGPIELFVVLTSAPQLM